MNTKAEPQAARGDSLKLVTAVALAIAGLAAFYILGEHPLFVRLLALLTGVGLALALGARTVSGARAMGYVGDAVTETRKVVWPTRAETVQTSIAVFVMVLVLGLILFLVDKALFWLVRLITVQGG